MVFYHINEFCVGLKVIQNGEPCVIIDNEGVKPGKGQSFNRVRFKQLTSGRILERTFKPGECLESADVLEINLTYVYHDKEYWYFMYDNTFDQISIHIKVIKDSYKWIVEQCRCVVTLWNDVPILVTPPNFVELKVVETTPVLKGSSSVSSGTKLARVSTGAIVKVPMFIQLGEFIRINTRLGKYVARVK